MKRDEFHNLILKKLDDLDAKVDGVRTTDIPNLKTDIAGFNGKVESLKEAQTRSTRIHTIVGAALAVLISKFTGAH